MNGGLEGFVFLVVRIIPLVDVGSKLLHELFLNAAVLLDFFVGELDGLEHVVLGNLVHFTFDHHNVLLGCGNHEVKVCPLVVLEAGVDDEFAVDAGNAHLAHWTAEGEVAGCECCRSCKSCKSIGLDILFC